MARLFKGDKERKQRRVWQVVKSAPWGVTEAEAADTLGMERRTINNYLRTLDKKGEVRKEGRRWFGRG